MRPSDLAINETIAFVLAHLAEPHQRILDVGCGTGLVARQLQAHGHQVVAIDESVEHVQQACALGVDARVAVWPSFADNLFDVVLFVGSLHHISPLAGAVEHAHRLLASGGLVMVEDFAWTEIDPVTAQWFYGVVRLLNACRVLVAKEDSFAAELERSGGTLTFWQQSHDHDLHTVTEMWSVLRFHFQPIYEGTAPYLYRYLCPSLTEDDAGYEIASQVREMEQRLANLGTTTLIGRHFVGRKR